MDKGKGIAYDGSNNDSSQDESFQPAVDDTDDSDEDDDFYEAAEAVMATFEGRSGEGQSSTAPAPEEAPQTPPEIATDRIDSDGYLTDEPRSILGSDSEDDEVRPPEFHQPAQFGHIYLELGMTFPTLQMFKDAVKDYSIALGRVFKYKKNEKDRCRIVCAAKGCQWLIYCSWAEPLGSFQIKTFNNTHDCCREMTNPLADRKWVGKKLVDLLRKNPAMKVADAHKYLRDKFQVQTIDMKIYRALEITKKIVEGSEKEQYAKLRDYFLELHTSNPGSTVGICTQRVDLTEPNRFDKLYICFSACKTGVMNGCRPLIGLDGCFLKGYYGGTLLAAVAQDANNSFYVIAYAIVEQETKETWTWFLTMLFGDIGSPREHGWEFISDMQKGLLPAMQEVCPGTLHRFCVKHLEANVWKQWRSAELRLKLWACAKSRTMPEFQKNFQELKLLNEPAWIYLNRFPPSTWSRAGFSCSTKNPALLSNMCEQFNAAIVNFREQSIITMLENIRTYMVTKMNNSRKKIASYGGPVAPVVQTKIEVAKKASNFWHARWAGDCATDQFEIQQIFTGEKHVVHLLEKTCSCREWDLSGIPCCHATAAIGYKGKRPEDYVSSYLTKERWEATYRPFIKPVRGEKQWEKCNADQVEPPHYGKGGGRPKKKKRTKTNDVPKNPFKAKKVRRDQRCGRCGTTGHNSRNCKGTAQKKVKGSKKSQSTQKKASGQMADQSAVQVQMPDQSSVQIRGPTISTIPSSDPFLFIPTPTLNNQVMQHQPTWCYGGGMAPNTGPLLPSMPQQRGPVTFTLAAPSPVFAGTTAVATRPPPRRPPVATRPSALYPSPTIPPAPVIAPSSSPTATTPIRAAPPVPATSKAKLPRRGATPRFQGHTFSSRGKQCVSVETLQRASRTTRSMAASLNISTQESTAFTKRTSPRKKTMKK